MSNFGAMHLGLVTPFERGIPRGGLGCRRRAATGEGGGVRERPRGSARLQPGGGHDGHWQSRIATRRLRAGGRVQQDSPKAGKGRVAILFGSEKTGLSNNDLSHCHFLLRIPTRLEHRSMNLRAGGRDCRIRAFTWGGAAAREGQFEIESSGDEGCGSHSRIAAGTLYLTEYTSPRAAGNADEKLRRMLRRIKMNAADAEVLLGCSGDRLELKQTDAEKS